MLKRKEMGEAVKETKEASRGVGILVFNASLHQLQEGRGNTCAESEFHHS